jgi:hypothetical protein
MVRSNRGRSAALRHIWAWPVYSGRRFVTTFLVLVVLVVVGGKISRTAMTSSNPAAPLPAVTITQTATAYPSVSGTEP